MDIGVGSGCIILTILKEKKTFQGTGIDISKKCINTSKINAKILKVDKRIRFYKSDVDKFSFGKYDIIVSNPPYIVKHKIKYLQKNKVINLLKKEGFYINSTLKDLANNDRCIVSTKI